MGFLRNLFLTALILSSFPLFGQVNKNNDVQLWLNETVQKEISSYSRFNLTNEWRIGDDITKLYFIYLQGIFQFKVTDFTDINPGYRQTWNKPQNRWLLVYEPLLDVVFHRRRGSWELSLRNRLSYHLREASPNLWQYRGRFQGAFSWNVYGSSWTGYLANELFLNTRNSFSQDRITAGLLIPFANHFRGNFYFMLRFLKRNPNWVLNNIFGASLTVSF